MSEFNGLVEREIPRLRRYARALTRSADRADDLVQETLLRAISKSHLWQTGTDIRAWLFTIMHTQYDHMWRRASGGLVPSLLSRLLLTVTQQPSRDPGLMGADSVLVGLRAPPGLVGNDQVSVFESRRVGEQFLVPRQAIDVDFHDSQIGSG